MSSSGKHPFIAAFYGRFSGLLRWEDLDRVWKTLREHAGEGWFLYTVGEAPPQAPSDADAVCAFIDKIDGQLREGHREDYCGIVYVDDAEAPRFVKVFDPSNLGVVCGFSEAPPLPGWILSLQRPVDLVQALERERQPRRGWRRWLMPSPR
jgi:hypothetical protein